MWQRDRTENEMNIEITAKPLEWKPEAPNLNGWREWQESRMGFSIYFDPEEPTHLQFCASWGEGDSEHFGSLDEAKEWCQDLASGWVRDCGMAAVPEGLALVPSEPTEAMRTAHAMYGDTSDWWQAVVAAAPSPEQIDHGKAESGPAT